MSFLRSGDVGEMTYRDFDPDKGVYMTTSVVVLQEADDHGLGVFLVDAGLFFFVPWQHVLSFSQVLNRKEVREQVREFHEYSGYGEAVLEGKGRDWTKADEVNFQRDQKRKQEHRDFEALPQVEQDALNAAVQAEPQGHAKLKAWDRAVNQ